MERGDSPARMCELQAMTKTLRRKVARSVPGESEGFGDRRAEERVPEGVEHERQRAFRDVVILMPDGELRDEIADRIEDWIEGVAVAGNDHPGRERTGALASKGVEALVHNNARVRFPGTGALDRLGNARGHRVGNGLREFTLKARCRAEMVEQVGVRSSDLCGDGLQRHCGWPIGEEQLARGVERGGAALLRAQALPSY